MKKNDHLKYIGYEFCQNDGGYKVNTDTVCLGMFLDPMKSKTVLDIGTNTGALLLYAHKQGAGMLNGVDIHDDVRDLFQENLSRYSSTFKFYHCPVQELQIDPVDVIICNPPFFEMNNVTPDPYFAEAMFESSLPLEELFRSCRSLLKDNGEIYMIYPADRFPELFQMCLQFKLKIMKMRFIHDLNTRYALRVMIKLKIGKMTKTRVLSPLLLDSGEICDI